MTHTFEGTPMPTTHPEAPRLDVETWARPSSYRGGTIATLAIASVLLIAPLQTRMQAQQTNFTPGVAAIPTPTFAPNALTLQQVIDAAKTKNLTLLAASRNVEAIRAQELQAAVRANPTFTIAGQTVTLPNDGSEGNPPSYSAQVSRLFERGEKRRWRIDNAKATTQQTEAQYLDQQRQVIFTLKQAFTNMLMAKAALTLAQANLKEFRHEVDINNDRYKAGDIGKLDFERLDLQLAQFESDEATARVNLTQASYQIQTLIGIATPSDDPNAFDIRGEIVPPNLTADNNLPALIQTALTTRPDYLASQAAVRAADANVKLQFANGTTDPTIEGEYDRSGNYNSFGFNVSIPLRLFDRNQGNKSTSKFQAQSSVFSRDAAAAQVRSDVAQAWVGYNTSKALSERYSQHYIDESKDVLEIAQFAYEHGGIALIDYLDALRDARSVASNALAAYSQTWLAIHQLSLSTATEVAP
ncbi:outer membrane protein, cobalt-zinc-cadmium efflux system [Granulicella rosea]|uniref:Outer membrane protein, cobalt-zinc-cadmium efflux system n=2 Tax=Granulicella rosea TaxID=474952 RepID=A0A239E539_9BACT|nr:outer membrane protein, cobalt-zinc-cadmium efflux system [Granulicella rosea]